MSANFITNQEKFLSDIINGILPKTYAVDILVGYFYYSGYATVSEKMKDKQIRILVGLDVDILISKHIREVEDFRQTAISRAQIKEDYYNKFVKLFNDTDFLDSAEKLEQFNLFYGKILDGSLQIRKTLDPCIPFSSKIESIAIQLSSCYDNTLSNRLDALIEKEYGLSKEEIQTIRSEFNQSE